MELNEFISNFVDQFDETDAHEITADTEFKELDEWSSMVSLSVIAMADEKYGVQIKGSDIRDSRTVKDLFNRVMAIKSKQ